jgi:hypothetical protein
MIREMRRKRRRRPLEIMVPVKETMKAMRMGGMGGRG